MRSGFITRSQFMRGLDSIGVSPLHRLYLADHEIARVADKYADAQDPSRVEWKSFETDIEEGIYTLYFCAIFKL